MTTASETTTFRSAYASDRALLDAVRAVALAARPADPARCSQRPFNDARAGAGHPRLARADQIAKTVGGPWPDLLEVIFDPTRNELHWVALRGRDTRARTLTLDAAAAALAYSATLIGSRTVRPAAYERAVGPLRAADERRRAHGGAVPFLLPTAAQIEHAVGWDAALAAAGLDPRLASGGRRGVARADALEAFLVAHGYLVGATTLKAWARAQGFSLANTSHTEALDELRANRDALGQWTPPGVLAAARRPAATVGPALTTKLPRRRSGRWSLAEVRAGLDLAVVERARRGCRRLTQDLLKEIAKDMDGVPSWSSVYRVAKKEGLQGSDLLDEAERRAAGLA